MRPCSCDDCDPGGPYQSGQCRLCWLFHDPGELGQKYRRLWEGMEFPQKGPGPCLHLGRTLRRASCLGCRAKDVHLCLYEESGIKPHPECSPVGDYENVQKCLTCPHFEKD